MRVKVSLKRIAKHCTLPIEWYQKLGERVTLGSANRFYVYIDNGSDILAVAHLDTALSKKHSSAIIVGNTILSPALDDRLGAYVILELLPRLGVSVDVLLTTDEEIGASTAALFYPEKQYKWIFSLDRRGTDAVLYDYYTTEIDDRCYRVGLDVGWGTFSDIVELEHLGCTGINFGIGYHLEHTMHCYAMKSEIEKQIVRIVQFYRKYKGVEMPFYKQPTRGRIHQSYGYDFDDDDDGDDFDWTVDDTVTECAWCGMPLVKQYYRFSYIVCGDCADYIDEGNIQ